MEAGAPGGSSLASEAGAAWAFGGSTLAAWPAVIVDDCGLCPFPGGATAGRGADRVSPGTSLVGVEAAMGRPVPGAGGLMALTGATRAGLAATFETGAPGGTLGGLLPLAVGAEGTVGAEEGRNFGIAGAAAPPPAGTTALGLGTAPFEPSSWTDRSGRDGLCAAGVAGCDFAEAGVGPAAAEPSDGASASLVRCAEAPTPGPLAAGMMPSPGRPTRPFPSGSGPWAGLGGWGVLVADAGRAVGPIAPVPASWPSRSGFVGALTAGSNL